MAGWFKFGLWGRLLLPLVLTERLIGVVIVCFILKFGTRFESTSEYNLFSD